MIFAPLIEWLGGILFETILPWLARNFFVIILGWFMQWVGLKIASTHWGAQILSALGNIPVPNSFGTGFLGNSTVAGAYSMMNGFFPLTETFSLIVSYAVLLIACMIYRRTFALARTGVNMSSPK